MSALTYTRNGGFAGYMDRLEIGKDGAVVQTRRVGKPIEWTLSNDEIAVLSGLLNRPGLFDKVRKQILEGADRIACSIEYRGVTIDGCGDAASKDAVALAGWCARQLR
jgi:hypothetical protein